MESIESRYIVVSFGRRKRGNDRAAHRYLIVPCDALKFVSLESISTVYYCMS
jgi:hypothetical protein